MYSFSNKSGLWSDTGAQVPLINLYRNDGYVNEQISKLFMVYFSRNTVWVSDFCIKKKHGLEPSYAIIKLCEKHLQIGTVYCPPKLASFNNLKKIFKTLKKRLISTNHSLLWGISMLTWC